MVKAKTYDTHAVGKRKASVARVYMSAGKGSIVVNNRPLKDYFPRDTTCFTATQALKLLNLEDKFDLVINVCGGGMTGQAGAIRLGISRALLNINQEYRAELKKAGFLTRDARCVERKKYGFAGARRAFQFSKR